MHLHQSVIVWCFGVLHTLRDGDQQWSMHSSLLTSLTALKAATLQRMWRQTVYSSLYTGRTTDVAPTNCYVPSRSVVTYASQIWFWRVKDMRQRRRGPASPRDTSSCHSPIISHCRRHTAAHYPARYRLVDVKLGGYRHMPNCLLNIQGRSRDMKRRRRASDPNVLSVPFTVLCAWRRYIYVPQTCKMAKVTTYVLFSDSDIQVWQSSCSTFSDFFSLSKKQMCRRGTALIRLSNHIITISGTFSSAL